MLKRGRRTAEKIRKQMQDEGEKEKEDKDEDSSLCNIFLK